MASPINNSVELKTIPKAEKEENHLEDRRNEESFDFVDGPRGEMDEENIFGPPAHLEEVDLGLFSEIEEAISSVSDDDLSLAAEVMEIEMESLPDMTPADSSLCDQNTCTFKRASTNLRGFDRPSFRSETAEALSQEVLVEMFGPHLEPNSKKRPNTEKMLPQNEVVSPVPAYPDIPTKEFFDQICQDSHENPAIVEEVFKIFGPPTPTCPEAGEDRSNLHVKFGKAVFRIPWSRIEENFQKIEAEDQRQLSNIMLPKISVPRVAALPDAVPQPKASSYNKVPLKKRPKKSQRSKNRRPLKSPSAKPRVSLAFSNPNDPKDPYYFQAEHEVPEVLRVERVPSNDSRASSPSPPPYSPIEKDFKVDVAELETKVTLPPSLRIRVIKQDEADLSTSTSATAALTFASCHQPLMFAPNSSFQRSLSHSHFDVPYCNNFSSSLSVKPCSTSSLRQTLKSAQQLADSLALKNLNRGLVRNPPPSISLSQPRVSPVCLPAIF